MSSTSFLLRWATSKPRRISAIVRLLSSSFPLSDFQIAELHQEIIKLKTDLGVIERAQQLRKTYVAFPSIVKNLSEDLRAYAKRLGPFTDVYQQARVVFDT